MSNPESRLGLQGVATTDQVSEYRVAINNHRDSLGVAVTPIGVLLPFAGSAAPSGYLMCDGSAVSRTTYASLFAVIGTSFGSGNGSTTFNLPDLRGRVPVGADGTAGRLSANDTLGSSSGEEKHTLTQGEMPSHTHTVGGTAAVPGWAQGTSPYYLASSSGGTTGATGGGSSHNNMQPYLVVNYIIRSS